MEDSPAPEFLTIADNLSGLDRFNAERNWVEMYLTRPLPMSKVRQMTTLNGIIEGIHSAWAYKQLEVAVDGIIDFKLEQEDKSTRDLIRVRSMRNVHFDREWHELKIGENFEVTLEK